MPRQHIVHVAIAKAHDPLDDFGAHRVLGSDLQARMIGHSPASTRSAHLPAARSFCTNPPGSRPMDDAPSPISTLALSVV